MKKERVPLIDAILKAGVQCPFKVIQGTSKAGYLNKLQSNLFAELLLFKKRGEMLYSDYTAWQFKN